MEKLIMPALECTWC